MPGGVCAVLDYEVEQMTDYVAEMAVRVVMPDSPVSDRFRKFVTQILTATRLPSTTILLGMNYLAKRINTIKANPQIHGPYKASEGEVWRYLTVALLLASKFLDDNTFQNRSWSEVTSIPVSELNTLEFEWLAACHWQLYVNLDKTKDYQAWLSDWHSWLASRKSAEEEARAAERAMAMARKLSDLPTIQTAFPSHAQGVTSPLSSYSSGRGSLDIGRYSTKSDAAHYDWSSTSYHNHNAPITPPDSGYATPEHVVSACTVNSRYNEWFDQQLQYNGSYHHSSQGPNSGYPSRTSNYSGRYPYSPWEPSSGNCTCCTGCHVADKTYLGGAHVYSQAVVG
ncbi:cyclin-like protein [Ceratocystis pirilliformis]|uniref:Cyclin-like protein n=1 Tax=Ceratocystis pirilliformis TaxID=259994 RepID=A0ABR3ZQE2_9PEZI